MPVIILFRNIFYNKIMNPYGFLESKDFYYKEVKESPEKPKVYTKYNLILEKIENNENYTFGERDKLIRTLQYHLRYYRSGIR